MAFVRLGLPRVLAALVLAGGIAAGAWRFGPLLDPVHGIWAVARGARLAAQSRAAIPGLSAPVDVRYDDRGVPHIFARTLDDAQRALGYVVARDRLFQLELQARATAGTLSELVGPAALAMDREARRLGLAASADRQLAGLPAASPEVRAITAYAEGVNAWIAQLGPADLPLEYHLLNARPMRWEPVYSLYLLRQMGWTLAYGTAELRRERVAALVGPEAADALFPVNSPVVEPIEPGAGTYPRYDWARIPPPGGRADGWTGRRVNSLPPLPVYPSTRPAAPNDALGSNNWAVAPRRSASGHALLAGDPHLDLTLPSIWYEAHLVVASEPPVYPSTRLPVVDVSGVTIPGAPVIAIGFNRDVAWSFTATEADVTDYYAEEFDDPQHPARYRVDGQWHPLERRVETYRDPAGRVLAVDTLYATARGPARRFDGRWLSMRWAVLRSDGELNALLAGARARTADEWLEATSGWTAPALTVAVADRQGTIAIRATGLFPTRRGAAPGTRIFDGTTSGADWVGEVPVERYPRSRNPARGFVSSDNQQPLDPRADATYLGSDWEVPWRALRLNALLRADSSVTVDDMRRWQTDPGSARADFFVPYFLAAAAEGGQADRRTGGQESPSAHPLIRSSALLSAWDRRYTTENTGAALFELAMDHLSALTWDELDDSTGHRVATPRDVMLAELLQDPRSAWWDRRGTDAREDRDAILRLALEQAFVEATRRYGAPGGEAWRWDHVRHANIYHLLKLPALSALDLPIQGGRSTLNPSSGAGTQGASWRMVVDLGDSITALGTYPGGQSGNPVSPRYLDRLPAWLAGTLDTLRTPRVPADLPDRLVSARLDLVP